MYTIVHVIDGDIYIQKTKSKKYDTKKPKIVFVDGEIYFNNFSRICEDFFFIIGYAYIHGLLNKRVVPGFGRQKFITYYTDAG
jgi:hypothetical protein